MFDLTTNDNMNNDVNRATNLYRYLSGEVTDRSEEAVNNLLASYSDAASVNRCKPISIYAALAIARRLGPQLVTGLRKTLFSLSKKSKP